MAVADNCIRNPQNVNLHTKRHNYISTNKFHCRDKSFYKEQTRRVSKKAFVYYCNFDKDVTGGLRATGYTDCSIAQAQSFRLIYFSVHKTLLP